MKKQSSGRRVGFHTPEKKKSFRQAKLALSGRRLKVVKNEEDSSDALANTAETAATTNKKRGRPRKNPCTSMNFPQTSKRAAKSNASAMVKLLYSQSKIRGVRN